MQWKDLSEPFYLCHVTEKKSYWVLEKLHRRYLGLLFTNIVLSQAKEMHVALTSAVLSFVCRKQCSFVWLDFTWAEVLSLQATFSLQLQNRAEILLKMSAECFCNTTRKSVHTYSVLRMQFNRGQKLWATAYKTSDKKQCLQSNIN